MIVEIEIFKKEMIERVGGGNSLGLSLEAAFL